MMAPTGLLESFLGAIQASLSVLLVIFYGGVAARLKLLDSNNTKAISKICVRMFLPALLITKIGSELEAGSAGRYVIIVIWALVCHLISFLIGIFAHLVLKMPDWTTVALMFNNTTSYPLLLISALAETGILEALIVDDETSSEAIERAKSFFLVFATISSCLTFAVGPRLIDTEHAPESDADSDGDDENHADGPHNHERDGNETREGRDEEANEHTSLLPSDETLEFFNPFTPRRRSFFPSTRRPQTKVTASPVRRASIVTKDRWRRLSPRTKWWFVFASDFFNAPLLGAIIGAIIGLVPALHKAFFNESAEGGIFTAWLTASLKSIGGLFVPLPIVVAGVSLYTSYVQARQQSQAQGSRLPYGAAVFILVVRFVLWPAASISFVYGIASRTELLGDDPMLWFTMMLMPTGPPAMKLITLVQVSDAGEGEEASIAKLLTVSYIISPVLSCTVVGALMASRSAL